MKIAMACDHGGFHLKEHIKKYLTEKGIEIVDHGTYSEGDAAEAPSSKGRTFARNASTCSGQRPM